MATAAVMGVEYCTYKNWRSGRYALNAATARLVEAVSILNDHGLIDELTANDGFED